MYEWQQLIQTVVNEMDDAIMRRDDQALTLRALAARLHYSEYHATHKFREIAGMSLRTYLHQRRLAFALKEVRDTDRPLLDIALDYGFSGQDAFTRAFKALYGELAAALDMPRDQMIPYIRQTWAKWPEQLPKQGQEEPAEAAEVE